MAANSPELRLWRGVLAQAALDLLGISNSTRSASMRSHLQRTAAAWRLSREAEEVAHLAQVDLGFFDVLLKDAVRALHGGTQPHRIAAALRKALQRA